MINLQPHTWYQLALTPGWTREGIAAEILVAKASFQYDNTGIVSPLEQSEPLLQADAYPDDDLEHFAPTAINEMVPFKQGAELIFYARAHCQKPRPAFLVKAELTTASGIAWHKEVTVIGPRRWRASIWGATFTDPEPITELPISYEYAYGGRHPDKPDDSFPTNPVGLGYLGRGFGKASYKGMPVPQLEPIRKRVKSPANQPNPIGLGPIPAHWQPRIEAFSSLDAEKAARLEFPFSGPLPPTAYHSAPGDQWFDQPLAGPCTLVLTGLTEGLNEHQPLTLAWNIPTLTLELATSDERRELTLKADTLIVDTQQRKLHLLYRHAFSGLPERFWGELRVVDEEPAHA